MSSRHCDFLERSLDVYMQRLQYRVLRCTCGSSVYSYGFVGKIIEINILVHKFFGTIGKSGSLEDSVTTERMLTWFLKIYYCSDTIPLELIDDVPFSNDP